MQIALLLCCAHGSRGAAAGAGEKADEMRPIKRAPPSCGQSHLENELEKHCQDVAMKSMCWTEGLVGQIQLQKQDQTMKIWNY
jgi:hypothetical protein